MAPQQRTNARGVKNRPNWILGVVVGAVITLAAVVVWLSLTRSTTTLAAGSPERTVQAYLQALTRHDLVQAARLLDPSSGCGVTDLEEIGLPDGLRVTLVSSGVKSDLNGTGATGGSGVPTAHVTVLIRNDDAPLGGVGDVRDPSLPAGPAGSGVVDQRHPVAALRV